MRRLSLPERFWSKVDKHGPVMPGMRSRCWTWTAALDTHGYGCFRYGKNMRQAYHVAWILTHGQIDEGVGYHGTCLCHRCDNPTCVRPDHLFEGTHLDNHRDKAKKLRGPRGSAKPDAKLVESQVTEIRSRYDNEAVSQRQLAREYGVSHGVVRDILLRRKWRHVA